MYNKPVTSDQVLAVLVETPQRIVALTNGLLREQLHTVPDHDAWSVNDVLAHLRSCADVWGNCMMMILTEDQPTLRAVNPTTWIKQTDYPDLDFHTSWYAFTSQRDALLAVLEPLPSDVWSRAATVTGAGRVLERTVLSYGQWLANHERSHVKQITNIINTLCS